MKTSSCNRGALPRSKDVCVYSYKESRKRKAPETVMLTRVLEFWQIGSTTFLEIRSVLPYPNPLFNALLQLARELEASDAGSSGIGA